jgi:hypothetical protein
LMWTMITICVATPIGMVTWFKLKNWL